MITLLKVISVRSPSPIPSPYKLWNVRGVAAWKDSRVATRSEDGDLTVVSMHLAIILSKGFIDVECSAAAAHVNLWLWPLSPAYAGKVRQHGFILGFGNTPVAQTPNAIQTMNDILEHGLDWI